MLINLLKSPIFRNGEGSGKVIRNPYLAPDHIRLTTGPSLQVQLYLVPFSSNVMSDKS